MHNPLRSEADVFRWAVVIGLGAASVIVLTLLTRPEVGLILLAALLACGVGLVYFSAHGSLPGDVVVSPRGDGRHRILVVANQTVAGRALLDEIRDRATGRATEILVITPALAGSRAAHWASDIDDGLGLARQRLERSLAELERAGLTASGEIGDSDPNLAIEDALRNFAADELIISTHPPRRSRWLEKGVVERARDRLELPVTHVVVDLEAERPGAATGARA